MTGGIPGESLLAEIAAFHVVLRLCTKCSVIRKSDASLSIVAELYGPINSCSWRRKMLTAHIPEGKEAES